MFLSIGAALQMPAFWWPLLQSLALRRYLPVRFALIKQIALPLLIQHLFTFGQAFA